MSGPDLDVILRLVIPVNTVLQTCFQVTNLKYSGGICVLATFFLGDTRVQTRPDGDVENLAMKNGSFAGFHIVRHIGFETWVE